MAKQLRRELRGTRWKLTHRGRKVNEVAVEMEQAAQRGRPIGWRRVAKWAETLKYWTDDLTWY